jgi:hypothetical protein
MVGGAFSSGKVCGLVDVGTSLFVGGIVTVVHGRFINIFYSDLLRYLIRRSMMML